MAGGVAQAAAPLIPVLLVGGLAWYAWRRFAEMVNAWSGDPHDPLMPGAAAGAATACEELYGKERCDAWAAAYRAAGDAGGNPLTKSPIMGPYLPPSAADWDANASAPVPPDQSR